MNVQKVLIGCAAVLVCAGCATAQHGASTLPATNHLRRQVEVSRAQTYQTMLELRKDSTAVLRVTATTTRQSTAADRAGLGPLRAVLTTVHVDQHISGSVVPGTVQIRQLSSPGASAEDLPPLLIAGQTYDLYVMAFEFVHGHPIAGTYVVTGDVGQFHVGAGGTLHRALPAVGSLPSTLSQAQLEQDARR